MGITGPATVGVALLFVEGYDFPLGPNKSDGYARADRPNLVLKEVWIENLGNVPAVDEVARPILDTRWRGFGKPRCAYYDDAGNWNAGK